VDPIPDPGRLKWKKKKREKFIAEALSRGLEASTLS
jgi:hypothetical protein